MYCTLCFGTNATTVYVKPTVTTTYTANSTNGTCAKSDAVTYSMETAVWNGSNWSTPQSSNRSVEFQGNYTFSGNLNACSCTVTSGNVIISSGNSMSLDNEIIVNSGSLTVESGANLIQKNNVTNTGNIIVKREAKMKRLEYTYWGSPVSGQNLKNFSPSTLDARFYVYNENNDYFDGVFNYSSYPGFTIANAFPLQNKTTYNFEAAKGYTIRAPNSYTGETAYNWTFTGIPNNGNQSITIYKTTNGNNLVSNPYPSNISFSSFYSANSSIIEPIARFWTNQNTNPPQQGSSYNGNNYATRNLTAGTPATNSEVIPTDEIVVGQGFMIRKTNAGSSNITFNNTMRVPDSGNFFNAKKIQYPIYWLRLTTPVQNFNTIAIGYIDGATNNFDKGYDAEPIAESSDSFYSVLENKNLIIQGREKSFTTDDVIQLGGKYFEAGNYKISLNKKEGIFNSIQSIYLKDKLLNKTVNLSNSDYEFYSEAGTINNRFEIVYKPDATLGTDDISKDQETKIYENGDQIVIENRNQKITEVQVFDASGRLLKTMKPNENKVTFTKTNFQIGLLVFKLKTKDKITSKKFLVK